MMTLAVVAAAAHGLFGRLVLGGAAAGIVLAATTSNNDIQFRRRHNCCQPNSLIFIYLFLKLHIFTRIIRKAFIFIQD